MYGFGFPVDFLKASLIFKDSCVGTYYRIDNLQSSSLMRSTFRYQWVLLVPWLVLYTLITTVCLLIFIPGVAALVFV